MSNLGVCVESNCPRPAERERRCLLHYRALRAKYARHWYARARAHPLSPERRSQKAKATWETRRAKALENLLGLA